MAGYDTIGRYHVLHPRTREPVCATRRCSTGAIKLSSMTVTEIHSHQRCYDFRSWPTYWKRPAVWPQSRPPRIPPPRWWVWWTLYDLQGGRCAACALAPPHRIDRDVDSDLVLGLVCNDCFDRRAHGQQECPHAPVCFTHYLAAPPAAGLNGGVGWRYSMLPTRWRHTEERLPHGIEAGQEPVSPEELRIRLLQQVRNGPCGRHKDDGEPCRAARAGWPYGRIILWGWNHWTNPMSAGSPATGPFWPPCGSRHGPAHPLIQFPCLPSGLPG